MSTFLIKDVEQALFNFLTTFTFLDPPEHAYKGLENQTIANDETTPEVRVLPCYEVVAQSGEPYALHSGNFMVNAEVRVRANLDDMTDADFRSFAVSVFDKVVTDTLAADLSAALEDFFVEHVNMGEMSYDIVERSAVAIQKFSVYCGTTEA